MNETTHKPTLEELEHDMLLARAARDAALLNWKADKGDNRYITYIVADSVYQVAYRAYTSAQKGMNHA